jgi:glyoxylase-like metal-dependent hydrolase (beta-lactamase superfamily II)
MNHITQVSPELYLIGLDQPIPGFTSFISSWVYRGKGKTFLVDVGPAATVPALTDALKTIGAGHLDAVLLTHIHIDHAGGIRELSDHFPETPIVCHSSAIPHLTDPTRLWEGSLKTLGDTARAYGPIRAVSANLLRDAETVSMPDVKVIPTPGHAQHHISFLIDSVLFAGEASGVCFNVSGSANADCGYLRPATPPKFFLETSLHSIDSLLATPHKTLCFGHFGAASDTPNILKTHREQILLWLEIIRDLKNRHVTDLDIIRTELLNKDPRLYGWRQMPPLVQAREKTFMNNSIRGYLGYLEAG